MMMRIFGFLDGPVFCFAGLLPVEVSLPHLNLKNSIKVSYSFFTFSPLSRFHDFQTKPRNVKKLYNMDKTVAKAVFVNAKAI